MSERRLYGSDRYDGKVTICEFELRDDGTLYMHDIITLPLHAPLKDQKP
jgi:hypothetical protein